MYKYSEHLKNLWRPPLKKPQNVINLDHNEPPFGPLERVRKYPNAYSLYEKLSEYLEIPIDNIILTAGSEQAIRFAFDAFVDPGATVIYPYPTFGIIEVFVHYRKAKKVLLEYDPDRHINLYKSFPRRGSFLYLANPDNPTGACYSLDEIIYVLENFDGKVLLDEAYWGYYSLPTIDLIHKYKNLIITRTFSKAFGIPGARVGFAISSRDNIDILRKLRPINELPTGSINAALLALDRSCVRKNKKQVNKWKNIFKHSKLKNFTYLDAEGNFILLKSKLAKLSYNKLLTKGIATRADFPYPLNRHLRISIGRDKYMRKTLRIIQKIDKLYSKRFASVHHKEHPQGKDVSP